MVDAGHTRLAFLCTINVDFYIYCIVELCGSLILIEAYTYFVSTRYKQTDKVDFKTCSRLLYSSHYLLPLLSLCRPSNLSNPPSHTRYK